MRGCVSAILIECSPCGREETAGLSGSSTGPSVAPVGLSGQVVAGVGSRQAALRSPAQLSRHGQSLGRCKTSRPAEQESWAGTAISCRWMVAVVALAWNTDAMAPAARVRLNAIAASTSLALLVEEDPDGKCARAPGFRSAMARLMIARPRWSASAWSMVRGEP